MGWYAEHLPYKLKNAKCSQKNLARLFAAIISTWHLAGATEQVPGGAALLGASSQRGTDHQLLCHSGGRGPRDTPASESLSTDADPEPLCRELLPFHLQARVVAAGVFMGCKEMFWPKQEKPAGQPAPLTLATFSFASRCPEKQVGPGRQGWPPHLAPVSDLSSRDNTGSPGFSLLPWSPNPKPPPDNRIPCYLYP